MFWTIFWPVFAALVCGFVVTEIFNFSLGYYLHLRQDKMRKAFEDKVASGEIDPMQMMFGAGMPGMSGPMMNLPALPTASGEANVEGPDGHGQYL